MEGRTQQGPGPAVIENMDLRRGYGLAPLFAARRRPPLRARAPRPSSTTSRTTRGEGDDLAAREPQVARAMDEPLRDLAAPSGQSAAADPKDFLDLLRRYRTAQRIEARRRARAGR